ncbi:MAG: trypsin-like peptidase domain-containing protein [Planctomycetes bacterium]|nr:trypsin-like peptidase domain-containing protein [Planctomycetota bacterium]
MRHDLTVQRLSLVLMTVSLVIVLGFYGLPEIVHRVTLAVERGRSEAAGIQLRQLGETSEAFRLVAKRVAPAVVNVSNLAVQEYAVLRRDPFGRRYRDREYGLSTQGTGSGIVVDPKGYVVTNNHVVRGADRVQVRFSHGEELGARLVGSDPHTDLAVLKVEQSDLVAAEFGDSDELEVGDWVLAIGNPFGLEQSVTAGIISAKGRSGIVEEVDIEDFLQTDAAINPGNSGGPLVNLKGQVVGVNSAILTESGGYQGVGFAIPSNMARSVVESLIAEGKVTRGWLGIKGQPLTPRIAQQKGLKTASGIMVMAVVPGSPAARAGLRIGDLIISMGGRKISRVDELRAQLATARVGSTVKVTFERDGTSREVEITIEEQPAGVTMLEDQFGFSTTACRSGEP